MTGFRQIKISRPDFLGELFLPDVPGPAGLVIIPSSAGIVDVRERAYAASFSKKGVTCLIADAFGLHAVSQCLTDQTLLKIKELLQCAMRAQEYLAARHGITHIGVLGVSKGGAAALLAAFKLPGFPDAPRFDFHLCLCPSVSIQLRRPKSLGGRILLLTGEKDDFTGSQETINYAQRILSSNPGLILETHVLTGASHAWESRGPLRWLPEAEKYQNCKFFLEDDGTFTDTSSGQNMNEAAFYESLRNHATYGAHYGGGNDELFATTCNLLESFILPFL